MQLPKISSRYGAPMGRTSALLGDGLAITVEHVPIDAGGYDDGGAYWGAGKPLFMATDDEGSQSFLRAESLAAAIAAIGEEFPDSTVTESGLSDFELGAIEAAFFTANPLPASGGFYADHSATWDKLSPDEQARFRKACAAFLAACKGRLPDICDRTGNDMRAAGRDFHYSSNGHGCGFWDGGWGRFGDALYRIAKRHPLPEVYADLDCDHHRETGEGCGECEACEAGPAYFLG